MYKKKKATIDNKQMEQLSSPLTKQLLEEIRENFETEIKENRKLSGDMRNQIVAIHKQVMEETVDNFIRNLLTTVVSKWADKNRRTNNGRRRTDGII